MFTILPISVCVQKSCVRWRTAYQAVTFAVKYPNLFGMRYFIRGRQNGLSFHQFFSFVFWKSSAETFWKFGLRFISLKRLKGLLNLCYRKFDSPDKLITVQWYKSRSLRIEALILTYSEGSSCYKSYPFHIKNYIQGHMHSFLISKSSLTKRKAMYNQFHHFYNPCKVCSFEATIHKLNLAFEWSIFTKTPMSIRKFTMLHAPASCVDAYWPTRQQTIGHSLLVRLCLIEYKFF